MIRRTWLALLLGLFSLSASAWSRPGHMVSGAIVYEELNASDPQLLAQILELMARHPERAPFEVAVGREGGEERARRMLMEMARWPDDIRGGLYDHATWHYSGRALSDTKQPPAQARRPEVAGAALEALALNAVVVADSSASQGERAVALCWLFHLVGDIHQPLHAADQVSATLPNGDRGGGLQFLLDPETRQPVTLHQFWDGAVHGSPEGASAISRARELRTKYPRSAFPELAKKPEGVRDFAAWAKESYDLARTLAYGPDLKTSAVDTTAPMPSDKYVKDATTAAERRVTLAAYRLTDLLKALLH
jgi:S1/P1 Nuclease